MSHYNELGYLVTQSTSKADAVEQPKYSTAALSNLTTASSGQTVYNTDAGTVQFYTGTEWMNLAVPAYSGLQRTSALPDPRLGQCVFNTDSKCVQVYAGSTVGWVNVCAPQLTVAQLSELTDVQDGMFAFNSTSGKPQYYYGGAWRDFGTGGGGSSDPVVINTSTNYTVQAADNVIVCNAIGADIYLTLPLVALRDGKELMVIKTDASTHQVHIQTTGGQHIRTRTTTEQLLTIQDDRVDIMPISATSMWYLV